MFVRIVEFSVAIKTNKEFEKKTITLDFDKITSSDFVLHINKDQFINQLEKISSVEVLGNIKNKIGKIKSMVAFNSKDDLGILNIDSNGETIDLSRNRLLSELDQILKAKTLERCIYYIKRLIKSIKEIDTNKINDINLNRWKEYDEILTDSLWIFERRENYGAHDGSYWGNFIPQIPHQMLLRYTKAGDWVLDPFLGSGTTLIECKRLGRNGIGIELNEEIAGKAKKLVASEKESRPCKTDIIVGDSRKIDISQLISNYNFTAFQMMILHPPYHDIIKFSNLKSDLSNAEDLDSFLKMFGDVIDNIAPFLDKERYLVLVIGDKYSRGEWIPLGFHCMNEIQKRDFKLKSIIVKNFEETRGKRNQKHLWRYRALVGGFYVFKHEYIMIFKKIKN